MKIKVYSQWNGHTAIHARKGQFDKAAKLTGFTDFTAYASSYGLTTDGDIYTEWIERGKAAKEAIA